MNDKNIIILNLLLLSHERKMGGANKCLYELACEMKRRGHNVMVTVLFKNCPLDIELKKVGIDTIPTFYGWWQQPSFWKPAIKMVFEFLHWLEFIPLVRLNRLVRSKGIDVIYSNTSCIDIGMKLAKKTGVRHVWHFREFGELDYSLEYMLGRKKSLDMVAAGTDRIVFISKALQASYEDLPENAKSKTVVIYDGVLLENIVKEKIHNINAKPCIFLVSGNLSQAKNQMMVLEAALKVKNSTDYEFEVWIAGESSSLPESKAYKEKLKSFVLDNELDNVKFLGFVDDMISLRKNVDVEIVPSVSEAFGRVTVEAMMAHNLVLASDSGACGELIEDGVTGYLFPNQDIASLIELMKQVLSGAININKVSSNACLYASENYSSERNANQLELVFNELLV